MGPCYWGRLRACLIGKLSLRAHHRAIVTFESGVEASDTGASAYISHRMCIRF